ncbi:hypothetical protein M405DRAFT_833616 [Rhizopogon salebrosus TDB-379]|nr:hypothetical protein M405DRAFT_835597 [Rhizopogon salebrosus TDB-379]KAJ8580812.1 hypothetical protein M405DRAFT_833616 [Rhizopogon salebrosus TDB-379]
MYPPFNGHQSLPTLGREAQTTSPVYACTWAASAVTIRMFTVGFRGRFGCDLGLDLDLDLELHCRCESIPSNTPRP